MPTWSAYRLRRKGVVSKERDQDYGRTTKPADEAQRQVEKVDSREIGDGEERVRIEDIGFEESLKQVPRHWGYAGESSTGSGGGGGGLDRRRRCVI